MKFLLKNKRLFSCRKVVVLLLLTLLCGVFFGFYKPKTVNASADSYDSISVNAYSVDMTLQKDRKVVVKEVISVTFLQLGLSMFYRSLPTERTRYFDITATCEDNDKFTYYVIDNPDISGFIDVCCEGNTFKGQTWTYTINYTMEAGVDMGDDIFIDVIGFGWPVALHNVTAKVTLPAEYVKYTVYSGAYGASGNEADVTYNWLDKQTIEFTSNELKVVYNDSYEENMAEGISLGVQLPKGAVDSYAQTRWNTKNIGWICLAGVLTVVLSVALYLLLPKKQDLITTVNVSAPDEMDPMQMGKWLDGTIDNEDITSMIYYFAHKGYLKIDFSNTDNPVLLQKVQYLPESESKHAKTLFFGLFNGAKKVKNDDPFAETFYGKVSVKELQYVFYEYVDDAKKQIPTVKMYKNSSKLFYLLGGIIGILFTFLTVMFISKNIGGGYFSATGLISVFPVALLWVLGYIAENYSYKWKNGARWGMRIAKIVVAVLSSILFVAFFVTHFMTEWEKLIVCLVLFACTFSTQNLLARKQSYLQTLGHIVGFRDFILVTEEDKIKFMLEDNPELYYKVLPYAQVLGVTNEWEGKFKNITLEPPTWYVGNYTLFDYMLIDRYMTRAFVTAMARPQPKGTGVSGGGGHFGGFGGGGFGGGGGGAR